MNGIWKVGIHQFSKLKLHIQGSIFAKHVRRFQQLEASPRTSFVIHLHRHLHWSLNKTVLASKIINTHGFAEGQPVRHSWRRSALTSALHKSAVCKKLWATLTRDVFKTYFFLHCDQTLTSSHTGTLTARRNALIH